MYYKNVRALGEVDKGALRAPQRIPRFNPKNQTGKLSFWKHHSTTMTPRSTENLAEGSGDDVMVGKTPSQESCGSYTNASTKSGCSAGCMSGCSMFSADSTDTMSVSYILESIKLDVLSLFRPKGKRLEDVQEVRTFCDDASDVSSIHTREPADDVEHKDEEEKSTDAATVDKADVFLQTVGLGFLVVPSPQAPSSSSSNNEKKADEDSSHKSVESGKMEDEASESEAKQSDELSVETAGDITVPSTDQVCLVDSPSVSSASSSNKKKSKDPVAREQLEQNKTTSETSQGPTTEKAEKESEQTQRNPPTIDNAETILQAVGLDYLVVPSPSTPTTTSKKAEQRKDITNEHIDTPCSLCGEELAELFSAPAVATQEEVKKGTDIVEEDQAIIETSKTQDAMETMSVDTNKSSESAQMAKPALLGRIKRSFRKTESKIAEPEECELRELPDISTNTDHASTKRRKEKNAGHSNRMFGIVKRTFRKGSDDKGCTTSPSKEPEPEYTKLVSSDDRYSIETKLSYTPKHSVLLAIKDELPVHSDANTKGNVFATE